MVAAPAPVEIFCAYTHEDEEWRRKLETHLSLLKRLDLISLWHDRLIPPGTDWAKSIDTHLETASVILFLVSADFFASDYCYGIEMKRALERQEAGEARVVPILVQPVDWKDAPFAHLQVLPTDAKSLAIRRDQQSALADVAAGIRRVVEDMPLLTASAPRATLPKIWNIPYPRNPFFLGRDAELSQVRQHLQTGQTTALSQPQAISGLGGIGKTQLALEYAYRYHQDYQAILWARAESTEALISSYVAIATLLRLPESETEEQEVMVQAVKVWLQKHRSWLLILDNADELALLPDFLPPVLGGHLILTTRAAATGRLAYRLEIEILEPEQGALFLLRRAGLIAPDALLEQASPQEQKLAMLASRELGRLPLALDQAGAYLEETGCDLSDYQQMYQQHRAVLLRERRGLVADHPEPTATTWSLSFQRVEEKNPAAADLLRLCAYLSPDAIPEEILTAGASSLGPLLASVATDTFLLNQAIEALRAYSLVRRDPREKTLSVHRLVQAVLKDQMDERDRHLWVERTVRVVNAALPTGGTEKWLWWERCLPHALACRELIEQYGFYVAEAANLLQQTGQYLTERGRYHEAESFLTRALQIQEQSLKGEHLDRSATLGSLAKLSMKQGKYAQAAALYQQILALDSKDYGGGHSQIAIDLSNLAYSYVMQGKYALAEALLYQALALNEQQLRPGHPDTISTLNALAHLYEKQGHYAQAEPLYQRILALTEQWLGSEHPDTAHSLNNLALLYLEQGQYAQDLGQGHYAQAESLLQRALAIYEQHLGPEHPDTANCMNTLAGLYMKQGQYAQAESLMQRALAMKEHYLGSEHPSVATSLNNLAYLYEKQGHYAQAESLLQRALAIYEQHLGPEHPNASSILSNLAGLHEKQGHYAQAEQLYQRALALDKKVYGAEHPEIATNLVGLANLYMDGRQYEQAKSLYQQALAISEQQLGPKHPLVQGMRKVCEAFTLRSHE